MQNMLQRFGYLRLSIAAHIASNHDNDESWDFWSLLEEVAASTDSLKAQNTRLESSLKSERLNKEN